MAFNVISFIEIANNTQTLKIIDFTCKLGFGPSKSPNSTVAESRFTQFLSDQSQIIGYPCHSLTDSLPNSCLVDFIGVTQVVDSKTC